MTTDTQGGEGQKNGRPTMEAAEPNLNNTIKVTRGQGEYVARKLINGQYAIHTLIGAGKAGNNPYQHIQPLVKQGIFITKIPVAGTTYHLYTVADAISRARIRQALNRQRGSQ